MASRTLTVTITGDPSKLKGALGESDRALSGFADKARSVGEKLTSAGRRMSIGITLPVLALAKVAFSELQESEKVAAQTNAVIKSTGGIANVSAKQVDKLAQSLMRKSGIDDELIKSGSNLLLTFKNVRNELGAGNNIFDRATKAALDLSVAGFGDMTATSKMLGKALNDPIAGMTALGRAGVTFSQGQKDVIKALVESGDVLGAQKIILAEVESQVGGSAEAFGKTMPGQIGKAVESLKNAGAQILKTIMPALQQLAEWALAAAKFFQGLPGPVKGVLLGLVGLIAVAGPLVYIFGALATVASVAATAIGFLVSPIGLVIAGIALLVAVAVAFATQWDTIWNWIKSNPVIAAVAALVATIMLPFFAAAAVIGAFAANWSSIWNWIKQAASDGAAAVGGAFAFMGALIANAYNSSIGPAINTIIGALHAVKGVFDSVMGAINSVLGGGSKSSIPPDVKRFLGIKARGGWGQGMTLVGEEGPEIVDLPPGSRVHSASMSAAMMATSGGGSAGSGSGPAPVHLYITVTDRDLEQTVTNAVIKAGKNDPRVKAALSN